MVGYRRNFVHGGTYFFTAALKDRTSTYLIDHIDSLLQSVHTVKSKSHFDEIATVILPDHLHTIWKLPKDDVDYPGRWKAIKSLFTRSLLKSGVPLEKNARGEYLLWQRRYWEHTMMDEQDIESHINYIHYNPVKHGHVEKVSDWMPSSFHRFVEAGILPGDWGDAVKENNGKNFGE
jgi:putative transposase